MSGVLVRSYDRAAPGLEPRPGVRELVLDRPEARNAISTAQAEAIIDACADLAVEPGVRAVVVSSADPRAYSVGADLKERDGFSDEDLLRQRPIVQRLFASLRDLPMPTVAAVHGYALGGGLELALSCDLIVVDETAVLGLPETSVGLVPGGGGTQLLARRIGASRAADLIFTARRIDADEAYRLGIADRLVPAGEAADRALELAATIAGNSPVGVRNAKRALGFALDSDLESGLAAEDRAWRATATSADRREGIAAFNQKRPPVWP